MKGRSALGVVSLLLLASCQAGGGRPPGPTHPERLEGRWALALRLESPIQLEGDTAAAGTVMGELSLIDDPAARGAAPAWRTHYGVYAADFSPFGFAPRTGPVPTAVARLVDGDSVEIALDRDDGDGVLLAGALRGDSVAGHWSYDGGRLAGAAGRFVMRRRRPSR